MTNMTFRAGSPLVGRTAVALLLLALIALSACSGKQAETGNAAAGDTAVVEQTDAPPAPVDPAAETRAEVPALDAFHEVIYPLWHEAWPMRDLGHVRALLPDVRRHVAAVDAATLPGILRDKEAAWTAGVAELDSTLVRLETAVAADDSVAILDAVEMIHSNYEHLVRTIRPAMKELDAFHVELYKVYHHALPDRSLDALRAGAKAMVDRADALLAAPLPGRFEEQRPSFEIELLKLREKSTDLVTAAAGNDWDAIQKAVDAVHDQYVKLEGMFDRPSH